MRAATTKIELTRAELNEQFAALKGQLEELAKHREAYMDARAAGTHTRLGSVLKTLDPFAPASAASSNGQQHDHAAPSERIRISLVPSIFVGGRADPVDSYRPARHALKLGSLEFYRLLGMLKVRRATQCCADSQAYRTINQQGARLTPQRQR